MDNPFKSLEEAILCFYDSQNPLRSEAQKWLTELVDKPESWRLIWEEMLTSEQPQLQFYGATALHSKLLRNWNEVPLEEYETLKTRLMEAIMYFKAFSSLVHERLCMSFAVYVIRTTTRQWPNAVSDIVTMFQPQNVPSVPEETLACVLLEILSAIPEQFQTMILTRNEKIFIKAALDVNSEKVISLLENTLMSRNMEVMQKALKCAKSWLEYGIPVEKCEKLLDILISIITIPYSGCDTKSFQDFQTELSKHTIPAIEAVSILCNHPSLDKYINTVTTFLQKILLLSNVLKQKNAINLDSDVIGCLCTLFVEIGESHLKLLISLLQTDKPEITHQWLRIMLDCTDAPGSYPKDEVYSTQTFNFWYQLQDEVLCNDTCDPSVLNTIKPFYKLLVPVLLRKSMFPENLSEWSKQDQDYFRCYRQDIADTYMYCYCIVGVDLVDTLLNGITYAIYDMESVNNRWAQIEAYLHAFHAISENLVVEEHEQTEKFLMIVQSLPLNNMNPRIAQTALEVIGSYAEWFSDHPHHLGPVLQFLLPTISNKQLASSATLSLKDIARECHSLLLPHAEQILPTLEDVLSRKMLGHNENVRIIFAIGKVLLLLPVNVMIQHLDIIVAPYVQDTQLMLTNERNIKLESLIHCVNVMTQLFLALEIKMERSPVYILLENSLPMYREMLARFQHPKLTSSICTSLKCALCSLDDYCGELISPIVDLIVSSYQNNPDSAFLDLTKQIMIIFGSKANYEQPVKDLIRALCVKTVDVLSLCPRTNLSECSSLMESFYQMCTQTLKKSCNLLIDTQGLDVSALFVSASVGICVPESITVKAISSFLCNVIISSRDDKRQVLLMVVQNHGCELTRQIIYALGKVSPRSCLDPVTDVLIALNKKYGDSLARWLQEVLRPDDFPTSSATPDIKNKLMKIVLKERANKRKVYEIAREFSFTCRGLINKEYIAQTTANYAYLT